MRLYKFSHAQVFFETLPEQPALSAVGETANPLLQMRAGLISSSMQPRKTRQRGASLYIDPGRRVDAADLKIRLAERDRRLAADTRTDAQRWLGDPPSARSALGQRNTRSDVSGIIESLIFSLRR